jgi:hypothetical protein
MARPSGPLLSRLSEFTGAANEHTPPTVLGPLPPDRAVGALLAFLRQHGYLAPDPEF